MSNHIIVVENIIKEQCRQLLKQQGATVDIKEWMNYDPYLGRIAGQHRDPEPNQEENPTS